MSRKYAGKITIVVIAPSSRRSIESQTRLIAALERGVNGRVELITVHRALRTAMTTRARRGSPSWKSVTMDSG